jgi:NADH-quinone oxidoreductase subunit G
LRTLVGAEQFYLGVSELEHALLDSVLAHLREGPARTPSLREVEGADAVLVLGEDVTNTAPMLALALRQSAQQTRTKIAAKLHIPHWDDAAVRAAAGSEKAPFFIAALTATKLDDIATRFWRDAPDELARLGFAIAGAIDPKAPRLGDLTDEMRALAEEIGRALIGAEHPLIVSGPGCGSIEVIRAAASIAAALCRKGREARLSLAAAECNSTGLGLMQGKPLHAAMKALRHGEADTVIVLENDLYRRAAKDVVDAFLESAPRLIAIDHTVNATTAQADIVLPAATFAESDGTLVNNEGRAQRYFQVFVPEGEIQESWRWTRDMLAVSGRASEGAWGNLDDIIGACATAIPAFAAIVSAAPDARFRLAGQKIAREPHRYSGRTAMHANVDVHETRAPVDPDSALAFSMEGYPREPPPPLIPYFWAPGWNSVQSVNKFQAEVGGSLRGGDPGVRLIEPTKASNNADSVAMPARFERRAGAWLIVPLHHIFGSEELSVIAPGVRELAPAPYVALNPDDAGELGVGAGDLAELRFESTFYRLPVQCRADLRRGLAGLPVGLPGLHGINLPGLASITKAEPT